MNILELFSPIRIFVFDIDGVLTDGKLLVSESGALLRTMDIKDGYALQLAIKKGYKIWVLSGGNSIPVKNRLLNLGVTEIHLGIDDKCVTLQNLIKEHKCSKSALLYMGDDMPDWKVMQLCGLKTCPSDAVSDIRILSDYTSPFPGGKGCVRDVIEKVLKLNGDWE